jgi:hypothetical protein
VEAAAERPSFSDERLSSATDSGHDLCFFVCLFSCRERERERERERGVESGISWFCVYAD